MIDIFHNLKNNDEIIFINIISGHKSYYVNDTLFYDNPSNPISSELFQTKQRATLRYYAHIIVNNEYKILRFGYTLAKLFTQTNSHYIIKIKKTNMFNNYEDSYLSSLSDMENTDLDLDIINKNKIILNKFMINNYWDSEKNFEKVYEFLKENDLGKIPQLNKHLRKYKLQRLLDETKKAEIFDVLDIYAEENNLEQDSLDTLIKGGELIYNEIIKQL